MCALFRHDKESVRETTGSLYTNSVRIQAYTPPSGSVFRWRCFHEALFCLNHQARRYARVRKRFISKPNMAEFSVYLNQIKVFTRHTHIWFIPNKLIQNRLLPARTHSEDKLCSLCLSQLASLLTRQAKQTSQTMPSPPLSAAFNEPNRTKPVSTTTSPMPSPAWHSIS